MATLVRDSAGNILPLTAMSVFVLTALVGSAVDLSRVYHAQNRLQSACDAGVLAGRRAEMTNGYDTNAQATAQTYFKANFDETQQGSKANTTTLTTTTPDSGNTVNGSATTTVPMLMMHLFGKTSIVLTSKCTGTMGIGNSDVTFVLDTTGSMSDTMSDGTVKITGLKAAVKNFWVTLNTTVANTNARVRYAFVPYSTTVNVGAALNTLNNSYLADSHGYQSVVPLFDSGTNVDFANYTTTVPQNIYQYNSTYNGSVSQYSTTAYSDQDACMAAYPSSNWVNGTTTTTNANTSMRKNGNWYNENVATSITSTPQTLQNYSCWHSGNSYYMYVYTSYRARKVYTYDAGVGAVSSTTNYTSFDHYDFKLVKYDTSVFNTFAPVNTPTGSGGATQTSTWDGCIEERATVPATTVTFDAGSGAISPSGATDLDIDSAPTSNESTKWAPMWPTVTTMRTGSSSASTYAQDIVLGSFGNSPGYACPAAAKTLQSWTQTTFNSYVDTLTPNGDTYHDIGMIWGARLSSPTGIWSTLVNTAPTNAGNVARHIIYMTDGIPNSYNYEYQAYGIEAHDKRITTNGTDDANALHEARFRAICDAVKAKGIRIWVIGYTSALTSDLSYCASPNSSYTAYTSSEINTAFQQIAKQIGELRISG
ncbi:TadE/TadG family type IV pilus assembly protein [Novosphingobium sp.]|uniref:Tad domain-containing protein n=1 Tax=Novosphingobium sp. TaxID=1874826 RepID=UPI0025D48A93|nr:TadE/TadG family type IV pilus assembly protein [Novosphingobium sp.]